MNSFDKLCLADRIKFVNDVTKSLDEDQTIARQKIVEILLTQNTNRQMLEEALCDIDVSMNSRIADIENALCDISLMITGGTENENNA